MESTNYKPIPALGKDILTPLFDGFVEVLGLGTAFKKQVVERAQLRHGERLLDVGCGTATLLLAAKAQDPSIEAIGIDSDERVLALARKKIAANKLKVEVMQARAEHLPFPADSFDIVISTLIFHHLPTEVKKLAMQEIYRVLKPGGRFLLADFGQLQGALLKTLFALATLLPSREVQYSRDNQEGKLPLFLEEAGFAVTELGRVPHSEIYSLKFISESGHSFACLDVPARTLKVEENAWLIADDPGIMSWRGNSDITRSEIVYCAIV